MTYIQTPALKYKPQAIAEDVQDQVAVEEVLNIAVNHVPYTMTMRTPGSEEALVRGILLSEDVYTNWEENPIIQIVEKNNKGYITHVNALIKEDKISDGIHTKRNLVSVSSCGMCGKESFSTETPMEPLNILDKVQSQAIELAFEKMKQHQVLFEATGGTHAAAIFDKNLKLLGVEEDIGRHNAVDKIIGLLLNQHSLNQSLMLLVSGRLSYEIVSKCYRAQIPILASVSAPSSMAIEYAQKAGISLLAFCRKNQCTVYTHTARIY
ncbi:MAG: formate dehydrogenase accessory sulfurtransferase FdhD [Chitinophagaceae bacterium]